MNPKAVTWAAYFIVLLFTYIILIDSLMQGVEVEFSVTRTVHVVWNNEALPSPEQPVTPPVDRCMDQVNREALPWQGGSRWFKVDRLRRVWFPSPCALIFVMVAASLVGLLGRLVGELSANDSFVRFMEEALCSCIVMLITAQVCGITDVWVLLLIFSAWLLLYGMVFCLEYVCGLMQTLYPLCYPTPYYQPPGLRLYLPWSQMGAEERAPMLGPWYSPSTNKVVMKGLRSVVVFLALCEVLIFVLVWFVVGAQFLIDTLWLFRCVNGVSYTRFNAIPVILFVFQILIHGAVLTIHLMVYVGRVRMVNAVFIREMLHVLSRFILVLLLYIGWRMY